LTEAVHGCFAGRLASQYDPGSPPEKQPKQPRCQIGEDFLNKQKKETQVTEALANKRLSCRTDRWTSLPAGFFPSEKTDAFFDPPSASATVYDAALTV
jgi:hypothetical protein